MQYQAADTTELLRAWAHGDPAALDRLTPHVYRELRRIAGHCMQNESPARTIQATALVHEAYLRLVDGEKVHHWNSRGHFFAAAAEAMRRILVDSARRKRAGKHGGGLRRVNLDARDALAAAPPDDLLAVDEALERLTHHDPKAAQLVKLHCFAGLTVEQAAAALGLSRTNAYRLWTFARAWLYSQLAGDRDADS
jgi:RNA polymerase sigma factor (TIGR02999 family)